MADSKKDQKKNKKRKPFTSVANNNEMTYRENARFTDDTKKNQKQQKNKISKGGKNHNNNVNKNGRSVERNPPPGRSWGWVGSTCAKRGDDVKNRRESDDGSSSFVWLTRLFYIVLALGFIYIVDFEKFSKIRDSAYYCLNKTVSYLPPVVVKQGEVAVEYIRPVAVDTVNKLNVLLNDTSTFINTNPLLKEHWTNVREISSICSARLVDYMRTLYVQTTGYCLHFKKMLI